MRRRSSTCGSCLEVLGTVLIGAGLWRIWPPLTWIFAGLACFIASWLIEVNQVAPLPAVAPNVLAVAPASSTDDEWMTQEGS